MLIQSKDDLKIAMYSFILLFLRRQFLSRFDLKNRLATEVLLQHLTHRSRLIRVDIIFAARIYTTTFHTQTKLISTKPWTCQPSQTNNNEYISCSSFHLPAIIQTLPRHSLHILFTPIVKNSAEMSLLNK